MKIKIIASSGNLRPYMEVLEKYKVHDIVIDKIWYDYISEAYITITGLKQIFILSQEVNKPIIFDYIGLEAPANIKEYHIEIYDDYRE